MVGRGIEVDEAVERKYSGDSVLEGVLKDEVSSGWGWGNHGLCGVDRVDRCLFLVFPLIDRPEDCFECWVEFLIIQRPECPQNVADPVLLAEPVAMRPWFVFEFDPCILLFEFRLNVGSGDRGRLAPFRHVFVV